MAHFAKSISKLPADPASAHLAWLAGLLEAEGTFLRPPPSAPNCPIVSCRMTDRDVVERVADRFGTAMIENDKGRYRTEYAATLKGRRAVTLMTDIKPLLGERRQAAISEAVCCFQPPPRKLDFLAANEIRYRYARSESVSSLARSFGVTRQTIHQLLQGQIYGSPPSTPWRVPMPAVPAPTPMAGISMTELHWLAGWLEGEGSFLAPPPSDPRRPRISGRARDEDVMQEVGRLLRRKPMLDRSSQIRNPTWSTLWRVLLQGNRAVTMMRSLKPLMGMRRQEQIQIALTRRAPGTEQGSDSTDTAAT